MNAAVIAFSDCGAALAEKIVDALNGNGYDATGHVAARHAE